MPDFYKKITDRQGGIEDLVRKIPGFKGYFERQDRRAADKLLREKLARSLEETSREFTRLQRRLVSAGAIQYMERVQAIDVKLRTFIDKVESASQGYAGLFDVVKIDENALAGVYAFDNALFAYQEQLMAGLKQLEGAIGSDSIGVVLDELELLIIEVVNTFDRRVEVLRGMQDAV
jgi:hypothetical protein